MEKCPCKKVKCEYHGDCAGCRKHHEVEDTRWKPTCDRLAEKAEARKKKRQQEKEEKTENQIGEK